MLLESLLALLIFSLGILGMVAINARAIQAATDAEFRTDAAKFAEEIATQISLNVDRTTPQTLVNSLNAFAYSGAGTPDPIVARWLVRLSGSNSMGVPWGITNCTPPQTGSCWNDPNQALLSTPLPGVNWANQQIEVTTNSQFDPITGDCTAAVATPGNECNRVAVTIRWSVPNAGQRQHTVVFFVH